MKRPQSAKPGHKGNWGQASVDDIYEQANPQKLPTRKQVKLMKPDLTTHDFARILPRKIHQDKQRLYSQALQLKQSLNQIAEENIRLKTKISILEREKDKMNKFIDTAPEAMGKASRINVYQTRSYEKDNMIIRNLKKIVRQSREENDSLRIQSQKIKKMMKYTKINELEIERKVINDQNKRLNTLLEEYSSQFTNQEEIQRQNEELKKYLEEELEEKQQMEEQKEKYEEIIDSIEEKLKIEAQKYQSKQKRLLRDLNAQKRRVQEFQRKNDQLGRELKSIRDNQQFIEQKQKNVAKSLIRTNRNTKNNVNPKSNTQQSENTYQAEKKYIQIKKQNQNLSKQLQQTKSRLKKAQSQITIIENKSKINIQSQLNAGLEKHLDSNRASDIKVEKREISRQQTKNDNQSNHQQDQYEQQFEKQEAKIQESQNQQQIQKYKKDFEENEQEQQLYKKEDKQIKKQNHNQVSQKKKDKKAHSKTEAFKPNKKILAEIKELLTFRMKSQRYPFNDIKTDIESAETSVFTYADLCNMLINEPFYLTSDYTKVFLSYCFERQKIEPTESISNAVLISKLRKIIDDFELLEENQEKQMIIRVAEMTSTYPRELQVAFENIKNGEETVARKDLIEMFRKLELEDKYIELIIAELSLCSDDLQHLNFHGFFERFYIEDENEQYMENNAIQEQGEESQESYKHSSRIKKAGKGNQRSIEDAEVQEIANGNSHI